MAHHSLLKEILDSLTDVDTINLFAAANGLTGDTEVENRLKELDWNRHIDTLWEELLLDLEPASKRPRQSLDNDQSCTSVQSGGGDENTEAKKPYFIWKKETRTYKKNLARDTTFKVKFNDQWRGDKLIDIYDKLHDMFDDVLSQARGHDADLGRVVLSHPNLNNPIVVPLQSWEKLNANTVMSEITKVLNSNETIPVDEHLLVTVGSIDVLKGGSWSGNKLAVTSLFGPNNSLKKKKSVLYVENDNNLCLPIAIGLCFMKTFKKVNAETWSRLTGNDCNPTMDHVILHRTVPKHYYGNLLKKSRRKYQTEMAIWLCEKAGVPIDRYLGLNDIAPFEKLFDVSINVVSSRVGNKFVRVSKENAERTRLFLYHVETENEKHWHGIGNIQGFFNAGYFCHTCLKPYKNKNGHTCVTSCDVCLHDNCLESEVRIGCRACGRNCRSLACFERHKRSKLVRKHKVPPACELWHQCKKCRVKLSAVKRNPKLHVCGEWQCSSCSEYYVGTHLCYQKAYKSDSGQEKKKFIFYDFETRQDDIFQCDQGYTPSCIRCRECVKKERQCASCRLCKNCQDPSCGLQQHKVNFGVLQTSCDSCEKNELEKDSKCNECGVRCTRCSQMKKSKFVCPPCSETCGYRELIFRGEDAAQQFCAYITQPYVKNSILIAHNAKSFDLYPILEVLIDKHSIRPDKIIYNGSKIMYMHIANKLNLTFLDSLNFLPMKLAKIPEAFGLEELSKGFFPHFFNTKERQTYVGPYPPLEYYGYNFMSSGERKKLVKWHASKSSEEFNFQKEMLKYCRSDVDILRRGCMAFRNTVLQATTIETSRVQPDGTISKTTINGVDPFDYVTIASVCMGIYKTLFHKHNIEVEITKNQASTWKKIYNFEGVQGVWLDGEWVALIDLEKEGNTEVRKQRLTSPIAIVPSEGYVSKGNYSKISIQWLEWLMQRSRLREKPVHILHALNGGEYHVPGTNYRCDGFVENPQGKGTIYEFYGCVYHGCPDCFQQDRSDVKHPATNQTLDELFKMTKKRERELKDLGYSLIIVWEHQFRYQLKKNTELQQFISTLDLQDRLDPRDSFFGGRTNAIKLHYKAKEDETIQYYDFTSLYPWTNKYCRYPVGHPTIITDNFQDISSYFGIAKIKVLPPRKLYHPVLPYRSQGKLKFPLCRTCADAENQHDCICSVDERAIIGTWCTPEIQMAVSKGYEILKIYEIYHFEQSSQYDTLSGEGGLFAKYVNTFLKIKQEASGFPPECDTEESKRDYIRQYKEKEGIDLEYDKIQTNPGLRCLAKLCLNSFWGKFGQRLSMKQSLFFHESETDNFFKILSDPSKVPHNFHIVSKDTLQFEWSNHPMFMPLDCKTNIFLASFTTAHARLRLYSVLDQLGKNVLYFDTDSVIFKSQKSDDLHYLPIGNYLGELTNEIKPEDGHIVEFVSGGPKNYAYRTLSGKEECKVRGFTLNWANSKVINFEAIKSVICTEQDKQIEIINPCKISRDSRKRKLLNRIETKRYQMVYTKRKILSDLDTLPFGF